MKHAWILALLLAACDSGNNAIDNTREVDKRQREHDFAPTFALDEALRTEGVATASMLIGRMQVVLVSKYRDDKAKLAVDLSGPLDAAKLQKLGMTENDMQGKNYRATDYSLSFNGSEVTVSAGSPGTRGYFSETMTLR